MTDLYWDPYDTDIDDNPYPIWKRLRAESPVYRNDRFDFWALFNFLSSASPNELISSLK